MESRPSLLALPVALCSLVFAFLVVTVSATEPQLFAEPLSNFRYGRWAMWGSAAFLLLIVIGLLYVAIAMLYADNALQFVAILSTILILIVSITPTVHTGHELAANGLMVLTAAWRDVGVLIRRSTPRKGRWPRTGAGRRETPVALVGERCSRL